MYVNLHLKKLQYFALSYKLKVESVNHFFHSRAILSLYFLLRQYIRCEDARDGASMTQMMSLSPIHHLVWPVKQLGRSMKVHEMDKTLYAL